MPGQQIKLPSILIPLVLHMKQYNTASGNKSPLVECNTKNHATNQKQSMLYMVLKIKFDVNNKITKEVIFETYSKASLFLRQQKTM